MRQPPKSAPPGPKSAPPGTRRPPPVPPTATRSPAAPAAARRPPPGAPALAERLRAQLALWLESLKRSDRFFRMRAGIVGSWLLISLVTMWAACPSTGPSNALGADVQVLRDSLVGGQQLLVRNESTELWTDVVLTLDDGWRREHKTVRPHDQLVLSMSDFTRQGQPAPRDLKPRRLIVECEQGRAAFDLR